MPEIINIRAVRLDSSIRSAQIIIGKSHQMSDIHFNCSKCTQRLVVDAAGIGLTIPCPTCKFSLVIPPKSSPRPVVWEPPLPKDFRPKEGKFTVQKLAAIVRAGAKDLECEIEDAAAALIARSSNGTPADATTRLRRILEYNRSGTLAPTVTLEAAEKTLKILFPENQKPSAKTSKN